MLTAQASKLPYSNTGGFGIACAALEAFMRQLAKEFGDKGIRAICMRSSGSPDARGVDEVFTIHAKNEGISRTQFRHNFA
jgi:3-oxoacyl-[acyl-carrier protein] reductase